MGGKGKRVPESAYNSSCYMHRTKTATQPQAQNGNKTSFIQHHSPTQ